MTQHPRIDELWLDLAEGVLPEEQQKELRAHLEACAECSAVYRRFEAMHVLSRKVGRRAAASAPGPAVPADVAERVLARARIAALGEEVQFVAGGQVVRGQEHTGSGRSADERRTRHGLIRFAMRVRWRLSTWFPM